MPSSKAGLAGTRISWLEVMPLSEAVGPAGRGAAAAP